METKTKLTEIKPTDKFYIIRNGKVVACRFMSIKIMPTSQGCTNESHMLSHKGFFVLGLADNTKLSFYTTATAFLSMPHTLYKTAEDALHHKDKIVFTITMRDFTDALVARGCVPTLTERARYCASPVYYYDVWTYARLDGFVGSRKSHIESLDLFKGIVTTEDGRKWYNTEWECVKDNESNVEVLDFPEDKEPEKFSEEDLLSLVGFVLVGVSC